MRGRPRASKQRSTASGTTSRRNRAHALPAYARYRERRFCVRRRQRLRADLHLPDVQSAGDPLLPHARLAFGWLAHLRTGERAPTRGATPPTSTFARQSLTLVGRCRRVPAPRQRAGGSSPRNRGVRALTAPFVESRARTLGTALA